METSTTVSDRLYTSGLKSQMNKTGFGKNTTYMSKGNLRESDKQMQWEEGCLDVEEV